MALPNAV